MDEIQRVLVKVGRRDLAQRYYERVVQGGISDEVSESDEIWSVFIYSLSSGVRRNERLPLDIILRNADVDRGDELFSYIMGKFVDNGNLCYVVDKENFENCLRIGDKEYFSLVFDRSDKLLALSVKFSYDVYKSVKDGRFIIVEHDGLSKVTYLIQVLKKDFG